MLNYMKSEFYRSRHNLPLMCLAAICLAGAALIVIVLARCGASDPTFPYSQTVFALSNIFAQLTGFLILAVGFSYVFYGTEDKDHTLKHTVSYGISRKSIYFGKFLTQAVVCIGIYYIICCIFAAMSYVMLKHSDVGEFSMYFRSITVALPILLWAVALSQIVQFIVNQTGMRMGITISITTIIPIVFNLIGRKVEMIRVISKWLPYNLIAMDGPILSQNSDYWQTVAGGIVWLVVTLIIGYAMFQKMEVK